MPKIEPKTYTLDNNTFGFFTYDGKVKGDALIRSQKFSAESVTQNALDLGLISGDQTQALTNRLNNLFAAKFKDGEVNLEGNEELTVRKFKLEIYRDFLTKISSQKDPKTWVNFSAGQIELFYDFFTDGQSFVRDYPDDSFSQSFSQIIQSLDWKTVLSSPVLTQWTKTSPQSAKLVFQLLEIVNPHSWGANKLSKSIYDSVRPELEKSLIGLIKEAPDQLTAGFMNNVFDFADDPQNTNLKIFLYGDGTAKNPPSPLVGILLEKVIQKRDTDFVDLLQSAVRHGHPDALQIFKDILLKDSKGVLSVLFKSKDRTGLSNLQGTLYHLALDPVPLDIPDHLKENYKQVQNEIVKKLPFVYRQFTPHASQILVLLNAFFSDMDNVKKFVKLEEQYKQITPPKNYHLLSFKSIPNTIIHNPQEFTTLELAVEALKNLSVDASEFVPWITNDPVEQLIFLANHENGVTGFAFESLAGICVDAIQNAVHNPSKELAPSSQVTRILQFFDHDLDVNFIFGFIQKLEHIKSDNEPIEDGETASTIIDEIADLFGNLQFVRGEDLKEKWGTLPLPLNVYRLAGRLLQDPKGDDPTVRRLVDSFNILERNDFYQNEALTPFQNLSFVVALDLPMATLSWDRLETLMHDVWPKINENGEEVTDSNYGEIAIPFHPNEKYERKKPIYLKGISRVATTDNEHVIPAAILLIDLAESSKDFALEDALKNLDPTAIEHRYQKDAEKEKSEANKKYAQLYPLFYTMAKGTPSPWNRPDQDPLTTALADFTNNASSHPEESTTPQALDVLRQLAEHGNKMALLFLTDELKTGNPQVIAPLKELLRNEKLRDAHLIILNVVAQTTLNETNDTIRQGAYDLLKEAVHLNIPESCRVLLSNVYHHYGLNAFDGYASQAIEDLLSMDQTSAEQAETLSSLDHFLSSLVGDPQEPSDFFDPHLQNFLNFPQSDYLVELKAAIDDYNQNLTDLSYEDPLIPDDENTEDPDQQTWSALYEGEDPIKASGSSIGGENPDNNSLSNFSSGKSSKGFSGSANSQLNNESGSSSGSSGSKSFSGTGTLPTYGFVVPTGSANPNEVVDQLFKFIANPNGDDNQKIEALDSIKNIADQFPDLSEKIAGDFKEIILMPKMPQPVFEKALQNLLGMGETQTAVHKKIDTLIRDAFNLAKSGDDFGVKILESIYKSKIEPFSKNAKDNLSRL